MKLGRFFHTVRYLRFPQIVGQIRYRLRCSPEEFLSRSRKPGPDFSGPGAGLPGAVPALPTGHLVQSPEKIRSGEFVFLNQTRELGRPPRWDPEDTPKLWIYNLHYFEWLEGLDYPDCRAAVADWIEHYPRSGRATGWEPYPVSLRLVNWLLIFYGKYFSRLIDDPDFREKLERSVYSQARWLYRHLETRLLGNHLLENAVALTVAGNLFGGKEAAKWQDRGLKILEREIAEQILDDGVHFELSPMYHLRVTWLMLLLAAGGGGEEAKPPEGLLERMLTALDRLTHPDGEISLFNDSAFGIYPGPENLRRAAETITGKTFPVAGKSAGGWELPRAGYFGFRDREGNCLICDVGPVGPDYIPGHGHGDIFSFELSLQGRRVVVDSGVSGYQPGPERDYDRSTRAHNTVEIGGEDQAEFWGAFRVGRRGRPRDVECRTSPESFSLRAWHDGYCYLRGAPVHRRSFQRTPDGAFEVEDRVDSSRPVAAVSRIHLHPDCRIEEREEQSFKIAYPGGGFRITFRGPGKLAVENSFYSPRFGSRLDNIALVFSAFGDNIRFGFRIRSLGKR